MGGLIGNSVEFEINDVSQSSLSAKSVQGYLKISLRLDGELSVTVSNV